jgi:AbrB-like transcriptional regulator
MPKSLPKSNPKSTPKSLRSQPQTLEQIPEQEKPAQQIPDQPIIPPTIKPEILTGSALLQKVKELGRISKKEKARACGYLTVNKNGLERVNLLKFMNAMIDAINPDPEDKSTGKVGRSASYRVSVQRNGNLLIGSTYTQQMGLNPGDELEIRLGRKHIQLRPLELEVSEDI